MDSFVSEARGYDTSGIQQALIDSAGDFIDPELYLDIDMGTRYCLQTIKGVKLTEREQTRTCSLVLQYIGKLLFVPLRTDFPPTFVENKRGKRTPSQLYGADVYLRN